MFEDFLEKTNSKNCGQDPKDVFTFFKKTDIWPDRVYFTDIDNFLKNTLTWLEFENLRIYDVSPKYFSFKSVCTETNFLDAINKILELQMSLELARKVYEYCQDQNAWPHFMEFSKTSVSIPSSQGSSLPSLCSLFDPPITSTQDKPKNQINEAEKEVSQQSVKTTSTSTENDIKSASSQEKSHVIVLSSQDSEISSEQNGSVSENDPLNIPLTGNIEKTYEAPITKVQSFVTNRKKTSTHKRLRDLNVGSNVDELIPVKKRKIKKKKENMPMPIKIEKDENLEKVSF